MWLRRLFNRKTLERDLQREMQFHLDAAVADHERAGVPRDEAIRRARIDFGGVEQMKEETRDARGTRWVEDFLADCRFALRGLRRAPGFAVAAILTIAIGVGANTAVWSIMDALMRRALPIENPGQLYAITRVGIDDNNSLVSYPLLQRMRAEASGAADFAGEGSVNRMYASIGERPEGMMTQAVSGNYLSLLRVRAQAGRSLGLDDDRTVGGSPVVVITDAFWDRRFARDPAVIGRSIRMNGFPVTIVGVLERGFNGLHVGNPVEAYIPASMQHAVRYRSSNSNDNGDADQPWVPQNEISWLTLITRVDDDARTRVEGALNRVFRSNQDAILARRDSATRSFLLKERIALEPIPRGFSSLRTQFRDPLRVLLAGVAMVLLITCANLAGLVLARGEARSHEMAIRASLGAKSGRLARQVTAESLTLAVIGGALGLVVATFVTGALLKLASGGATAIPLEATLSGPVLLFALGVTLFSGLVVGLAPALRVRNFDLYAAFKAGGRVQGGHRLPLGRVLVSAQIAIALILVTSAGAFVSTFRNFINVDAGFDREAVVTARMDMRAAGYTSEQLPAVHARLLDAARAVPGVQSASLALFGLGRGGRRLSGFSVPGRPLTPGAGSTGQENYVTPGYFRTVGIPLQRGRDFTTSDAEGRPPVAIVTEAFAKHFLGTTDAVGKRLGYGDGGIVPDTLIEVVGVVRDVRVNGLKDEAPRLIYHPIAQAPQEYIQSLDVRVAGPPEPVIARLRAAIESVDANLPVREVVAIGSFIERGLSRERLVARLAGGFGILALVLAAIGLYGVISYSVARRTNEMGLRLALGASPGGVRWLVLRDSLVLVGAGLAVGVALWFPVLGLTRSLLYGVSPHDPRLLAISVAVLLLVGAVAGMVPAIRASRIDPIDAIRAE